MAIANGLPSSGRFPMLGPDGAKVGSWPLLDGLYASLEQPSHCRPNWIGGQAACQPSEGGPFGPWASASSPIVLKPGTPLFGLDAPSKWVGGHLRPGTGLRPGPPLLVGSLADGPPSHPPAGRDPRGPKTGQIGPSRGPNFSGFLTPCGATPRGGGGAPPTTLILLRNQRSARAEKASTPPPPPAHRGSSGRGA